jgi:phytoene synthase
VPQEDLRRFGVRLSDRRCDAAFVALMKFEIARCRELYTSADRGVDLLPPASARCIRAARVLYSGILEQIEEADYDVFRARVRVPTWKKAAVAARFALGRG